MDREKICPWKTRKIVKVDRSGDGCHTTINTSNDFDYCEGVKCPFYDEAGHGYGAYRTCTRAIAERRGKAR